MSRALRACALSVPIALTLAACGTGTGAADRSDQGKGERLEVVASFYPLEYLARRVAGEHAEVTSLTSPGIDPHDVELTPRTIGSLGSADLVVFESGMQPAVDEAVSQQAADHSFDVTPAADLLALGESEQDHAAETAGGEGQHEVEDGHAEDEHDHGAEDPHFWLDPERYGDVAVALAEELAAVDPDRAADYRANAAVVVEDLEALDEELAAGLASCESREVVSTHDAFGYLGARYDLHLTGITGISPESQPSPARLAEVSALVSELGVTTVYSEPLLSEAIARTVAQETGAQVLTLDPADGLTEASSGSDYLDIMRANLDSLREGQGCS